MLDSFEREIIEWNNRFPVDRWWRNKYNIPFGSPAHRKSNFLDQLFEYREDKLFNRYNKITSQYVPGKGDWLIRQDLPEEKRTESLVEEARRELSNLPESLE